MAVAGYALSEPSCRHFSGEVSSTSLGIAAIYEPWDSLGRAGRHSSYAHQFCLIQKHPAKECTEIGSAESVIDFALRSVYLPNMRNRATSKTCIVGDHALGFSNPYGMMWEDAMDLKIETRVTDGVTIVSCHGRIMFGEEATELRDTLKRLLSSTRQIVINLSGVTYIDSGGLGTLVGVYSSARSGGADVKLTGLGQRLRDVLQVTKLVTVFEVYDSEQQAVAAFRRGAA